MFILLRFYTGRDLTCLIKKVIPVEYEYFEIQVSVWCFVTLWFNAFRFALAHAVMSISITLQAYGHVTMDCTIVAFYSQAKTQIQMLRHNLEQLVGDGTKINDRLIEQNVYRDNEHERIMLQRRFVRCVEHYKQITG